MILMAPFLFLLFSSLVFLAPSWDKTQYWDLPYKRGSGFAVGGSSSFRGTRQEGAAQHLAWVIVPWFSSTPAQRRGQVGTHEQSQLGQLQTPPHLQKPHPESPSPSLAVCRLLRKTHLSFDLKLCPKAVPGLWYLSDSSVLHIIFPPMWFGRNYLTKQEKSAVRTIYAVFCIVLV